MKTDTDLGRRMRARADADGLPADHQLRTHADAFDKAATGVYGTPQTTSVTEFMGAWARARKVWCAYSGEASL